MLSPFTTCYAHYCKVLSESHIVSLGLFLSLLFDLFFDLYYTFLPLYNDDPRNDLTQPVTRIGL